MNVRWLSSLLLAATASGFAVPFILPWNDSLPGVVTDFSALNPAISAASVVTVDTNGHFFANGQRVRFLGVNFAGDSPFMPTNKADAVAARLAKFGVNCVRFHHIDAAWAYGGGVLVTASAPRSRRWIGRISISWATSTTPLSRCTRLRLTRLLP